MERRHANKHTAATLTYIHGPGWPPWQPNWIDYRHSLVTADKRGDLHDELLTICKGCGCETDLSPAPHSPRCKQDA